MTEFDLTWLVESCGEDPERMSKLAILLATAALGEMVVPRPRSADRVSHFRLLIGELERRVRQ